MSTDRPGTTRSQVTHAVGAAVAWTGALMAVGISILGLNTASAEATDELVPGGLAGAAARVAGTMSYFTWLSNAVVAVSATQLALRPRRSTPLGRTLRLSALLMITVTFLIYHLVLAGDEQATGVDLFAKNWQHVVTPLVTWAVWLVIGPRGWITGRTVPAALVIPALWVLWTLSAGAVTGFYPYPFLDVSDLGYQRALANIAGVLVLVLALSALFWLLDRMLTRDRPRAVPPRPAE